MTIGYGHLCAPDHPPITQEEAEAYLAQDLVIALNATLRYCPVLATEPEGRLAAIVDFTFNLGAGRLQSSTLRRRVNQRDWQSAAHELRRWVYGGGKVLPGLKARREAEVLLMTGEFKRLPDATTILKFRKLLNVVGVDDNYLGRLPYRVYGDPRYGRLAGLSVSHLYNLRKSTGYQARRVCNSIGVRKAPKPNGRAGWVRIDNVPQGDLDGTKGVYHIWLLRLLNSEPTFSKH